MTRDHYKLALTDRRRMLADAGFVRDDLRIWSHSDGRTIGESVAAALTDEAFLRYLNKEALSSTADKTVDDKPETTANHPA